MQYFDFSRLVNKYKREIVVMIPDVNGQDEYDDYGDRRKIEPKKITIEGAVIRHRQSKIYRSDGTLTLDDYALYLTEEPGIKLVGSSVIFDHQRFNVESKLDNSEFTGIWAYNLKYVSAFKEDEE